MIASDIGEGHRCDLETIDTKLVETMAGRFQREMVDAIARQPREQMMQFNRIGGRVLERYMSGRSDQAYGSQAGGTAALAFPDVAREHGHRRLAVGPGDRGARGGLCGVEPRRQMREP